MQSYNNKYSDLYSSKQPEFNMAYNDGICKNSKVLSINTEMHAKHWSQRTQSISGITRYWKKILTKLGCIGGDISKINSENSFTDTWLWRNNFSARSISLKWNPTDGLSGEPGQNWQRTKVAAWLSQSQTATSFRCWLPTKQQ